ncbi:hypothetical protein BDZ91DRAFT_735693 [Kalaharituber pfeilii]|nr:hypothetical protein BDZ91DRAFT_735693 [Kalaharituber pfeilii]
MFPKLTKVPMYTRNLQLSRCSEFLVLVILCAPAASNFTLSRRQEISPKKYLLQSQFLWRTSCAQVRCSVLCRWKGYQHGQEMFILFSQLSL